MSTRFTDNTTGSASEFIDAIQELRVQGQSAIDTLVDIRENTLLLFNNALSSLNSKRVRANRLSEVSVVTKFVASDLRDINQAATTTTVRADSNSITLKERTSPIEAIVSKVQFSTSKGTLQVLNNPQLGSSGNLGALYRVATIDGSTPIGTFDIQLKSAVNVSMIIIDMMDMPSDPQVVISTSQTGVSYIEANSITRNGYRVAAYIDPQETQYIRIVITPIMPDILGGNIFTFGLTDLHAFSVQFHLLSNFYTNPISVIPQEAQWQFIANDDPRLTYFVTMDNNPAIEVKSGDIISVPNTAVITNENVNLNSSTGQLNFTLPSNIYLNSLQIIDSATSKPMRLAPGLDRHTTNITNQYVVINSDGTMYLIVYNPSTDASSTFNLSYVTGNPQVNVKLQVQLSTTDLNVTPVFSGAQLNRV